MTYLQVSNVKISGVTTCVPSRIEDNRDLFGFSDSEACRIIESTGIREKRVVDDGITSSDLCVKAAECLLEGLQWNREEIDCLIFVSTNRDYLQPTTSCVIHDRLKLKESCFVLDVPCGCPGWVYGLNIMGTYLQTGQLKKGLLLVGDTSTKMNYPFDKSTRPLFGDAGTASAYEYDEKADDFWFIEANNLPGMTNTSLVPDAAKVAGISYEDLCDRIARSCGKETI